MYGMEKSIVFLRSSLIVTDDMTASYLPFPGRRNTVPRGVLELDRESAGLCGGVHQVDVEADDVLVRVHHFHGRPRGIRGDSDFGGLLLRARHHAEQERQPA